MYPLTRPNGHRCGSGICPKPFYNRYPPPRIILYDVETRLRSVYFECAVLFRAGPMLSVELRVCDWWERL